jgi:hypothetical protein
MKKQDPPTRSFHPKYGFQGVLPLMGRQDKG